MAIPILYWMLECTGCHCRFVVHDSYLEFVGTHTPNPEPGDGYGAVPLPSRHRCVRGCPDPLQAIASMFSPDDDEMRLAEPYISVELPRTLRKEWRYLAADPTRFVQTPFPREQFLAEYARRCPVLTMTDHDGSSTNASRASGTFRRPPAANTPRDDAADFRILPDFSADPSGQPPARPATMPSPLKGGYEDDQTAEVPLRESRAGS
jgi:hypothetical protein